MKKYILYTLAIIVLLSTTSSVFASGDEDTIFLHHSTGGNLYSEGDVAGYFANYNSNNGTNYVINERAYPTSPYPWDNYPYDWWNLWSTEDGDGNPRTPACDSGDPDIECLDSLAANHDVVIFKQCFPGAGVLADTGTPDVSSSRKSLENYKEQYRALRKEFDKYPDTMFIAWTLVPLHRLATNTDDAARAKQFVDWVKNDWLTEDGQPHPNIRVFDFWGYAAESDPVSPNGVINTLKYDYERSHTGSDSHPNTLANQTIGPIFAQEIIDNIENFFQVTWWKPQASQNLTWQWQLNTGNVDTSYDVDMYDVDLFDTSQSKIDNLHAQGKKVVCYFSAGSWEDWRSDAGNFPESIKGDDLDGWAGEKWLDVRDGLPDVDGDGTSDSDELRNIMKDRLDLAVTKHCDGVEPDNVDGYDNNTTGFPLTSADQLTYNKWLATEAHNRGLSIGLKNDVNQINDLINDFDWALNEQCYEYDECNNYQIFVNANKPVFGVEYNLEPREFCPQANNSNYSWLKKKIDLDAWRYGCESYFNVKTPIYRLYNKKTGTQLYTRGEADRDKILNKYKCFEFTDGVPAFYASTTNDGTTPMYRLYNKKTGAQLYTRGKADRDKILNKYKDYEFTDGSPSFYASMTPNVGLTPMFRLYNTKTGMQLYTRGIGDRDKILNKYKDYEFTDGVPAFYAKIN